MAINGGGKSQQDVSSLADVTGIGGNTPLSPGRSPYDMVDIFGLVDGKRAMPNKFTSVYRVFEFVVVEEFDNCIECTLLGGKHFIAKPREVRRDTYDSGETINGVDYTYVAVNERLAEDAVGSEADESQVITPDYYAGQIIKASTGMLVTDRDGDPLKDEDGADMYLEEVTVRVWAVEQ